jgi:hypothetical protein
MTKLNSLTGSFIIIILLAAGSSLIYAQEEDYCINYEKKFRSVFNGSIVYGACGATSQLDRDENFEKYKPDNAFDNDLKTAWVEGKEEDGSGESLAFYSLKPVTRIGILPGYGTKKHFSLNNRVKSAELSIYEIEARDANQCIGMFYTKGRLIKSRILNFEDAMTIQYFDLQSIADSEKGLIYIIKVISVYKGSKYNDTCIAEVVTE